MMQAVKPPRNLIKSAVNAVFDPNAANFWLQKIDPTWSVNQSLGKIVERTQVANDTVSLKIAVNRKFQFGEAGQHHPVIVTTQGRCFERTYSLTKIDTQHVLLTAKKVDQGVVSSWINDIAQVGDIVEFGAPYGDMTLESVNTPLLMLAAGSGITPMYSLIKALLQQEKKLVHPVKLMYWAKKTEDLAFQTELVALANQHSNFNVEFFTTQDEEADSRLEDSHLTAIEYLDQYTVYACGPAGFVQLAEQLTDTRVHKFKGEAFSVEPFISDETGFVQVTLTKSNKVVTIPKGQSILASLEQQNIRPQHGCRMGVCNKCACHKAQGATKNLVNGAENTEPGNLLKICINSAQSDLTIDL